MLEPLRKAQEYAYTSLKYTDLEEIKIDPATDLMIEQPGFILV